LLAKVTRSAERGSTRAKCERSGKEGGRSKKREKENTAKRMVRALREEKRSWRLRSKRGKKKKSPPTLRGKKVSRKKGLRLSAKREREGVNADRLAKVKGRRGGEKVFRGIKTEKKKKMD